MSMNKLFALVALFGATASVGLSGCGSNHETSKVDGHDGVLRYVSRDGLYRVVGPNWGRAREIDGLLCYPVVVGCGEKEDRIYWCHETSWGSSGNFAVSSQAGDLSLSDISFCHSDEVKSWIYMDIVSNGVANRIELERVVD